MRLFLTRFAGALACEGGSGVTNVLVHTPLLLKAINN